MDIRKAFLIIRGGSAVEQIAEGHGGFMDMVDSC